MAEGAPTQPRWSVVCAPCERFPHTVRGRQATVATHFRKTRLTLTKTLLDSGNSDSSSNDMELDKDDFDTQWTTRGRYASMRRANSRSAMTEVPAVADDSPRSGASTSANDGPLYVFDGPASASCTLSLTTCVACLLCFLWPGVTWIPRNCWVCAVSAGRHGPPTVTRRLVRAATLPRCFSVCDECNHTVVLRGACSLCLRPRRAHWTVATRTRGWNGHASAGTVSPQHL